MNLKTSLGECHYSNKLNYVNNPCTEMNKSKATEATCSFGAIFKSVLQQLPNLLYWGLTYIIYILIFTRLLPYIPRSVCFMQFLIKKFSFSFMVMYKINLPCTWLGPAQWLFLQVKFLLLTEFTICLQLPS